MAQSKFYPRGLIYGGPRASLVEQILSLLLGREEIPGRHSGEEKVLYMRRFHLFHGKSARYYLHVFYRGDEDADPHDHPWDFESWILKTGYYDETWEQVEGQGRRIKEAPFLKPGMHIRRPASHIHRVRLKDPETKVWTFVKTSGKVKSWFFYTPTGPVGWKDYEPAKVSEA
jgi:hypothetical protein